MVLRLITALGTLLTQGKSVEPGGGTATPLTHPWARPFQLRQKLTLPPLGLAHARQQASREKQPPPQKKSWAYGTHNLKAKIVF